jgi:serine/threonine protein kinase
MHRRVALKVLPAAQANDPGAVERFYREARAVATLDHPNIVRAHDIDHDGKVHFLVMEYVDGSSLQDIVRKGGPLDVDRAIHYIRQAAVGLDAAHAAGLAHGGTNAGAPGPRPQYGARCYAAYLRDPDGLRIELVSGGRTEDG